LGSTIAPFGVAMIGSGPLLADDPERAGRDQAAERMEAAEERREEGAFEPPPMLLPEPAAAAAERPGKAA
jgi:hypothetical protein